MTIAELKRFIEDNNLHDGMETLISVGSVFTPDVQANLAIYKKKLCLELTEDD